MAVAAITAMVHLHVAVQPLVLTSLLDLMWASQPKSSGHGLSHGNNPNKGMDPIQQFNNRIKNVIILVQENHSFDQIAGGLNYTTDIDGLIFQLDRKSVV